MTTPNTDTVELATLVLPSHAAQDGLEAGDGDEVVLEALQDTVDNIKGTEHPSEISAVVNLEVLSELMGVSEEEFIADLHAEVNEDREFERENGEQPVADEEQPLIPAPPPEEQALISDRISLTADPFIATLADVLPSTKEETEKQVTEEEQGEFTEAAATRTDGDQHLAHDAFLLNIPTEMSNGRLEDHFVLALPEIHVEGSVAESTLSTASVPMMERAMSLLPDHLPSDVQAVHLEAHTHLPTKKDPTNLHLDLVVKRKVPLIGYIILISGLIALASIGAALGLQQGPSPTLKCLWRQMSTSLIILPMVFKSIYHDGVPQLTISQWLLLPVCALAYAYMSLAFVISLNITTMANAFVLSNMTSLVIIFGRAALGLPILRSEGLGAVIGFLGAAICATAAGTSSLAAESTSSTSQVLGNLVALSASFATALYLIIAKNLRSSLDLFVFMFAVMSLGSLALLCYLIVSGEEYTCGTDPLHGVFGWLTLTPDRLLLEIYIALICNCLGTTGYIAVMKYFEPIVPATVMLLEPAIGALLGTAVGTAPLPGAQTWFGDAVVAAGTLCVIWSGSKKTETMDATKALRPSGDDASVVSMIQSPLLRKPPRHKTDTASAKVVWDH